MSTYKTGRVYKIIHTQSDIVYVGSTFNTLRDRMYGHKKIDSACIIGKLIQQYGPDQFKIMLIKEYQVVDRRQLEAYEQLWINKLTCINKNAAFQPISEKELKKQYRKTHSKELTRRKSERYQKNRDTILERQRLTQRQQYADNKDAILERHRLNYKANKDKYIEKHTCDVCGGRYTKQNKITHQKTKKHQKALNVVN